MRKCFLALFAVVAMVACENESEKGFFVPDNPNIDSVIEQSLSEYGLTFDETGFCYSKKYQGLTEEEFFGAVCGYGWKEITSNRVLANGNLCTEGYHFEYVGSGPVHFYFDEEGNSKIYTSACEPWINYGYQIDNTYKDKTLYFGDYSHKILQVTDNNMVILEERRKPRTTPAGKEYGYEFTLNIYKRMTSEELAAFEEEYIFDPTNPEATPKYQLAFDENGVCYSQNYEGMERYDFFSNINGSGWMCMDMHRILDNGNIAYKSYWEEQYKVGPTPFLPEGRLFIEYLHSIAYPPEFEDGYVTNYFRYEDSVVKFDGDDTPRYRIIEFNDDEMVCIVYLGKDAEQQKDVYGLGIYWRMNDAQLWHIKHTHTVNHTQQ